MDQRLDMQNSQSVSFTGHPISPPVSTGATDSKGDSPTGQPLMMMSQGGQVPGVQQSMSLADHPTWNPARIFEQWNASFGTPAAPPEPTPISQARSLNISSSTGAPDVSNLPEYRGGNDAVQSGSQMPQQQYSAPSVPNFVTPAMWQESVASVYEGGLKRSWDYDGGQMMKRR